LSKFDIFFTNIFCESSITLLYNMKLFTNSLSSIFRKYNIILDSNEILNLFNKNPTPYHGNLISYIQSTIKYYTSNNDDNKYVNLYSTFNAINNYIYYNFNIDKKYKLYDNKAKELYKYLMKKEYSNINSYTYNNLDEINLTVTKSTVVTVRGN